MSVTSAESFVKKMYEDDEFLKELYRAGGFIGGKANNKEDEVAQNQKLAEISRNYGYDFTAEEYETANGTYIKSLGIIKGMKMLAHMVKIGEAMEKEN